MRARECSPRMNAGMNARKNFFLRESANKENLRREFIWRTKCLRANRNGAYRS